jgi:multiple sugar transport system ATP-binding protein
VKLPFGEAPLSEACIKGLRAAGGHKSRDVIVGMRPEHFEDAAIADPALPHRMRFKAKVEVVESMGSELYAYFSVESEGPESEQLAELAKDAGMEDLPSAGAGQQIVARLDAASRAAPDAPIELVLDTSEIKLFDPEGGRSLTHA